MKIHISPLLGGKLIWEIDDSNPYKMDSLEKLQKSLLRGDLGEILTDSQPTLIKDTPPLKAKE